MRVLKHNITGAAALPLRALLAQCRPCPAAACGDPIARRRGEGDVVLDSKVDLGRPLKGDPTCGSPKRDLIETVYIPKGPPNPDSCRCKTKHAQSRSSTACKQCKESSPCIRTVTYIYVRIKFNIYVHLSTDISTHLHFFPSMCMRTDRHTGRRTGRQTEVRTHMHTGTKTYRHTSTQTPIQGHTGIHTCMYTHI